MNIEAYEQIQEGYESALETFEELEQTVTELQDTMTDTLIDVQGDIKALTTTMKSCLKLLSHIQNSLPTR